MTSVQEKASCLRSGSLSEWVIRVAPLFNVAQGVEYVCGGGGTVKITENSVWRTESPSQLCPHEPQTRLQPSLGLSFPITKGRTYQKMPQGLSAQVVKDS